MQFSTLSCLVAAAAVAAAQEVHKTVDSTVTNNAEGRIAGGKKVEDFDRDYSFQVQVVGLAFCSGFIINEHYILTAAHCVQFVPPRRLEVLYGSSVRERGHRAEVNEIKVHPKYNITGQMFDVAYVKTVVPFEFNDQFQPAVLAERGSSLPKTVTVTGWGKQSTSGKLSDDLMMVELPIINNMMCQAAYPDPITRNMFCGQNTRDRDKGACKGDGGAPASHNKTIFGLSAYTRGCGPEMGPSVFTYLAAPEVYDFIADGTDSF